MKILFAIQGTGNGHLSRARDVYPELARHGEVDVLISGIQADVDVPFPVKFKLYGMSFIFGKRGGAANPSRASKAKCFGFPGARFSKPRASPPSGRICTWSTSPTSNVGR